MALFEILALVGLGFLITKIVQRGKDRSRDYAPRDRLPGYRPPAVPSGPVERSQTEEVNFRSGPVSTPLPQPQLTPNQLREKRMAELRRLYIADEITVEQYEQELDKLLRAGRTD